MRPALDSSQRAKAIIQTAVPNDIVTSDATCCGST